MAHTKQSVSERFGKELAELLACKIQQEYSCFDGKGFVQNITSQTQNKTYTQRLEVFSVQLRAFLPKKYSEALSVLVSILGEENSEQTGMFKHYYWVLPIGKFVSQYGLEDFEMSLKAIEEITKRSTGEFAIRPFIVKYPQQTLVMMRQWALSCNFHLRRLASEGLRPKLPWATQLDLFIDNPVPVFDILNLLKEDEIMYVKKSVANHLTDWIKVNPIPTHTLIDSWKSSDNQHTQWIVKRATRHLK